MINRNTENAVTNILRRYYSFAELDRGPGKYVKQFMKTHRELCEEEGVHHTFIDLGKKKLNKDKIIMLCAIPFSSNKLFQAFRDSLSPEIGLILDELVWIERLSCDEIEDEFEITIYDIETFVYANGRKNHNYKLKSEFHFFRWHGSTYYYSPNQKPDFTLFLPPEMRKILSDYYEKPEEASFNSVDPKPTTHTYSGEQDILLELPRIIAYAGQGQIKTTTKGKVQASTLNKMQRKLNLKEFYADAEDKELRTMRTALLGSLVTSLKKPTVSADTVKQLMDLMKDNYRNLYRSLQGIITYLKGAGHVNSYGVKKVEADIFSMFKDLPKYEWVSIDNIFTYIKYNFVDVKILSESAVRNKLYYAYKVEGEYRTYTEKEYLSQNEYHTAFINPLIKGTCFLFAAYGMLEIAYDTPDVSEMGKTAKSPYDELKYIRLTKLGAFILGIEAQYSAPAAINKSTIRLSENSLTVIVDESDTTAPVVLEPYTERVSPNRFRTDAGLFLKGVANQKQLDDKINLFKQSVKVDIPENWEHFFKELKRKIDPLILVRNNKIFQIPEDDRELLQLIAKDAYLQKICLKAEGYHVIVSNKNLPKFKKRLQEFGYLLS